MPAKKKNKTEARIIHIHAKCSAFEFFEQLPENKAEGRLIDIRDGYQKLNYHGKAENLIVKTALVNPTLF
jgi:hypothetical protein